ncbi:MAG: hypothetical protein Greene101449_640 [Candidatus Peregrinibacteria bacterium Greene1014_49]|nr:MAG: hypothetical protein Greene101449_640 [Candidatus Peregrinibacteria bacterium Greene1014_49]
MRISRVSGLILTAIALVGVVTVVVRVHKLRLQGQTGAPPTCDCLNPPPGGCCLLIQGQCISTTTGCPASCGSAPACPSACGVMNDACGANCCMTTPTGGVTSGQVQCCNGLSCSNGMCYTVGGFSCMSNADCSILTTRCVQNPNRPWDPNSCVQIIGECSGNGIGEDGQPTAGVCGQRGGWPCTCPRSGSSSGGSSSTIYECTGRECDTGSMAEAACTAQGKTCQTYPGNNCYTCVGGASSSAQDSSTSSICGINSIYPDCNYAVYIIPAGGACPRVCETIDAVACTITRGADECQPGLSCVSGTCRANSSSASSAACTADSDCNPTKRQPMSCALDAVGPASSAMCTGATPDSCVSAGQCFYRDLFCQSDQKCGAKLVVCPCASSSASSSSSAVCGNRVVEPPEECDAAVYCLNCRFQRCGDGLVRGVEQCDDGNNSNTDSCTNQCRNARCGDRVVQSGVEECDDGNRNDSDSCKNNCTKPIVCGDGIVNGTEECDDANTNNNDTCKNDCTVRLGCGNAVIEGAEECDDGNIRDRDGCSGTCRIERGTCGDSRVDSDGDDNIAGNADDEECDTNGVQQSCAGGFCCVASTCKITYSGPSCGNGTVECSTGTRGTFCEECDDGNPFGSRGACTIACKNAICGDGFIYDTSTKGYIEPGHYWGDIKGEEECDDGSFNNGRPGFPCSSTCKLKCGNGVIDIDMFEECDDKNIADNDGCSSACEIESGGGSSSRSSSRSSTSHSDSSQSSQSSKKSSQSSAAGQVCAQGTDCSFESTCFDNGGQCNGGCGADFCCCKAKENTCGNGIIDSGEKCESDAACASGQECVSCFCRATGNYCGDKEITAPEQCDDGNTFSGDGCSALCIRETNICGNGRIEPPEQCDDGNRPNDGSIRSCTDSCTLPVCGNGVLEGRELCDFGAFNGVYGSPIPGQPTNDFCTEQCKPPTCGDGIMQKNYISQGDDWYISEECDSPNAPCDKCKIMHCGDGRLQPQLGEECDAGSRCPFVEGGGWPYCTADEECEFCAVGSSWKCGDGSACTKHSDCRGKATCSYYADAPPNFGSNSNAKCLSTCKLQTNTCGNNQLDPGEQCESDSSCLSGQECVDCSCRGQGNYCGDNEITAPEQCDDGNTFSNDGCSSSCTTEVNLCGNGQIDPGEDCEAGVLSCASGQECVSCDCRPIGNYCGDGQVTAPEQCDNGNQNSNTAPDACRRTCVTAYCGDGVRDSREGCDPGVDPGCPANCGIVTPSSRSSSAASSFISETFPPSSPSSFAPPGSSIPSVTGSIIDNMHLACQGSTCKPVAGEGLDLCNQAFACGGTTHMVCRDTACVSVNGPGGNICNTNAGCGTSTHTVCNEDQCLSVSGPGGNECKAAKDCLQRLCGNGTLEPLAGEFCDDGNRRNGDGCSSICTIETRVAGGITCGDGIQTPPEECDDRNAHSGDGCTSACTIERVTMPLPQGRCADGTLNSGETCDDRNNLSGDGCSSTCQVEQLTAAMLRCGDSIVTIGEGCDDGNIVAGDGCDVLCRREREEQCTSPDQCMRRWHLHTEWRLPPYARRSSASRRQIHLW